MRRRVRAVSQALEYWSIGVVESWHENSHYSITPLLQVFREHELSAAAFQNVIDFIECIANEMQAETARFHMIVRASFHLMSGRLLSVVAQPHSNAVAQAFHRQGDWLVVAQFVSVTNDVGAGFIDAEHDEHAFLFGKGIVVEKFSHMLAHQSEIGRMAAELELPFLHRPKQTLS